MARTINSDRRVVCRHIVAWTAVVYCQTIFDRTTVHIACARTAFPVTAPAFRLHRSHKLVRAAMYGNAPAATATPVSGGVPVGASAAVSTDGTSSGYYARCNNIDAATGTAS